MVILQHLIHPGGVLKEEFLSELDLSAEALANAVQVSRVQIEGIVRREVAITADMAACLSKYLSSTPEFWLNLQRNYDLGVVGR